VFYQCKMVFLQTSFFIPNFKINSSCSLRLMCYFNCTIHCNAHELLTSYREFNGRIVFFSFYIFGAGPGVE
jgi:hypothetical protein